MKPIEIDNLDAAMGRIEKRVQELGVELDLLLAERARDTARLRRFEAILSNMYGPSGLVALEASWAEAAQ